jgi:hypothetical protein
MPGRRASSPCVLPLAVAFGEDHFLQSVQLVRRPGVNRPPLSSPATLIPSVSAMPTPPVNPANMRHGEVANKPEAISPITGRSRSSKVAGLEPVNRVLLPSSQ